MDIYPGDREEKCQGQMKPVAVFKQKGELIITHLCVVCGYKKNNKTSSEDNMEELAKISQQSGMF